MNLPSQKVSYTIVRGTTSSHLGKEYMFTHRKERGHVHVWWGRRTCSPVGEKGDMFMCTGERGHAHAHAGQKGDMLTHE